MALQAGRHIGQAWDDCQHLDELIKANRFNFSCKSERDFEMRLSGLLYAHRQQFKGATQTFMPAGNAPAAPHSESK